MHINYFTDLRICVQFIRQIRSGISWGHLLRRKETLEKDWDGDGDSLMAPEICCELSPHKKITNKAEMRPSELSTSLSSFTLEPKSDFMILPFSIK